MQVKWGAVEVKWELSESRVQWSEWDTVNGME